MGCYTAPLSQGDKTRSELAYDFTNTSRDSTNTQNSRALLQEGPGAQKGNRERLFDRGEIHGWDAEKNHESTSFL